jgi:DNA-nicking Smr family endonuclease
VDSEDEDLFLQEMADVKPLNREARVARRGGSARDSSLAARREAAVAATGADPNTLSDAELAPLDPWYVLEFKRPGIQNGVYRKLKQGRYEAEARLDLHRMTVQRARREVFEFVEESSAHGLRSVMLVHGKGETRTQTRASGVLKACVNHWLRELDKVQAFHSAQPRHGGTGAVYVLLKKSEEKKRENRELFAKGRVPVDR